MSRNEHSISPPVGTGDVPPLYKLPALKFQALCRDLLDAEVGPCNEFGVNGQPQYGIDLIARRSDKRLDIAQCKNERDFPPAKIRAATKEFLDHWEYWRDKNVARFILFVGSDLSRRQRQEEILKQHATLEGFGIGYEVWSASTIVNRLRPYRGLVTTHLNPEWVKYLCGAVEEPGLRLQLAGMSALTERLSLAVSDATDSRVLQAKELWLAGNRQAAPEIIEKIRGDVASWHALTPAVQASVLRLQASILVDREGDPAEVQELLVQAASLKPEPNDCLLRASLLWSRGKPEEALSELATADTDRARIQSAVYLAVLGRSTEATTALRGVTAETAERFRVEALVHLTAHRMVEARRASLKALELAPTYSLVRLSVAIVEYYSSLATDAVPRQILAWPVPVSWKFVRRDDATQDRLRAAGKRFRQLSAEVTGRTSDRRCLEVWRVACLANDAERQDAASAELERLLRADPGNHRLLVWATARFPRTDCTTAFNLLRSAAIDRRATSEEIIALAHYFVGKNQYAKALKLLDAQKDVFTREQVEDAWVAWKAQVLALSTGRQPALDLLRSSALTGTNRASLEAHIVKLTRGEPGLLQSLIDIYRQTGDARHLLEAVEILAQQGDWQAASEHCEEVLRTVGTAEVAWLVIDIAHRAHLPDLCLRLLRDSQPLFPQARLPLELRRLRVHSQHLLGFVPPAVEEAARIADEDPTAPNLLDFAQLLFSIGDQRRLCSVAERVLRLSKGVTTTDFLRLAWQCQWEDAALSRRLWTRAVGMGIPDDQVARALSLGDNLGLEHSLSELTRRMVNLASQGKGNVQLATIEQLKQYSVEFYENANRLSELYRDGHVPLHLVASPLNQTLAHFFHEYRNEAADSPYAWPIPPLLTRHGRKGVPEIRSAAEPRTLKADTSALLLAYHYGFLEQVEQAFGPIRIAPQLVQGLLLMQQRLATAQLTRMRAYRDLLSCTADGQISQFQASQPTCRDDVPDRLRPDWLGAFEHA